MRRSHMKCHWLWGSASTLAAIAAIYFMNGVPSVHGEEGDVCTYMCGMGTPVGCNAGAHKVWDPSTGERANAVSTFGTHPCIDDASCEDGGHNDCTPPEGLVDLTASAISNRDAGLLLRLLSKESRYLDLNTVREAFQLRTCGGTIVAHLPADRALINDVAAHPQWE